MKSLLKKHVCLLKPLFSLLQPLLMHARHNYSPTSHEFDIILESNDWEDKIGIGVNVVEN